jgi:peptide/nickel transport system substrate-binding protein
MASSSCKAPYAPLLRSWRCLQRHGRHHGQGIRCTPLKDFIGTGPYKFKERRTDQYVLLTKF